MLYFRNPAGQTAWALPPYIDQECKNRDYLSYGRLNVSCFQQVGLNVSTVILSNVNQLLVQDALCVGLDVTWVSVQVLLLQDALCVGLDVT